MMYLVQGEQLKTSAYKIQNRVADKQENTFVTKFRESIVIEIT